MSAVRGIRGAITVKSNDPNEITAGTAQLLTTLRDLNGLAPEDIGYIWFTVTPDLDAAFPADAARAGLGWTDVPLICGREIPVPGALALCVRVLIAWNTVKKQSEVQHAFMNGARQLRPAWGYPRRAPEASAAHGGPRREGDA
jgi:chorismate mutase